MSTDQQAETVTKRLFAALAKSYNLKQEEIVVVFLWGSRLWQTHNKNSDFDLIVIHDSSRANGNFGATPCPGIDVKCYSAQEFERSVCVENSVSCWLPLLLPEDAMLFAQMAKWTALKALILKKCGGAPRLDAMLQKLSDTLQADEARASKNAEGGAAKKAQKIIMHSFRLVRAVRLVMEATGQWAASQSGEDDESTAAAASLSSSSVVKKKPSSTAAAASAAAAASSGAGVQTTIDLTTLASMQDDVDQFFETLAEEGLSDDIGQVYSQLKKFVSPR